LTLAIISHTEHYLKDGTPVGWGPTVAEINHLATLFEQIWHVAVMKEGEPPASALPYETDRIHFVPLKPFGGPRVNDKIGILLTAPTVIPTVSGVLAKVDYWHFRAPTGIGVFLIPYLSLLSRKPGWFKYAGDWNQQNPPFGYRWQRLWLKKLQNRAVTINGRWAQQPDYCLSFENPCLTEDERKQGWESVSNKSYDPPWKVCFVGRLNQAKGVDKILAVFDELGKTLPFAEVHFVGEGPMLNSLQEKSMAEGHPFVIHGSLPREKVFEIYQQCHFLLLPSESEGFAKVIAEGANFGCIPLVSAVASIPQYVIDKENGFLWSPNQISFGHWIEELDETLKASDLTEIAKKAYEMAGLFTFERYLNRIRQEVLT
jgi:glycosyltransferase involved in cell wall biosynthesis